MLPLIKKERKSYNKQKFCHTYKKGFDDKLDDRNYLKVQDYRHYTGKYRGATCSICNLR